MIYEANKIEEMVKNKQKIKLDFNIFGSLSRMKK